MHGQDLFADVMVSPRMYADRFSFEDGTLHFCEMSPQTYAESTWLDQRKVNVDGKDYTMPLGQVINGIQSLPPPVRPVHYIFHSSHCGSTLISRCLDAIGGCLVLKEPAMLVQMSGLRRSAYYAQLTGTGQWSSLVSLVSVLLSRTFQPSDVAIVKATSICHNLMSEVLGNQSASAGLFLYSDLKNYLASMLKGPKRLPTYISLYFEPLRNDMIELGVIDRSQSDRLDLIEKAGLMWLARIVNYRRFLQEYPQANMHSLDFKTFLDAPEDTLMKLVAYFGLNVPGERIQQIITGGVMQREAKLGRRDYDAQTRRAEYETVCATHGEQIEKGMRWAEQFVAESGDLYALPKPLV